jgi:hypothetical protein
MRSSYGTVARKKILAYKPQLFQRSEDLLIFPGRNFHKWHNEITELLDGIYQINAKNSEKGRLVDVRDLDLAMALLKNIDEELDNIFNPSQTLDFNYHYVSLMDEEYKKSKPVVYGRYWYKIDRRVLNITPRTRYIHLMEIVEYANKMWSEESKDTRLRMVKKKNGI